MNNLRLSLILFLTIVLLLVACSTTRVQKSRVRGEVINNNQEPVEEVMLAPKNSSRYVKTDKDGRFSLRLPGRDTLMVMTSGNQIFQVPLTKNTKPQLTLFAQGDSLAVDDTTLTSLKGGLKQRWENWFSSLNYQAHEKYYSSIFDMVREKYPSVTIRGDEIFVRGPNSLNDNQPVLIVVDGTKTYNIRNLDPNNVESMELIKDSSTAFYGGQATGGVLKITTKKGGD